MSDANKNSSQPKSEKTLDLRKQTVKRLSIRSSIKTGMPYSCSGSCRTTCGCPPPTSQTSFYAC